MNRTISYQATLYSVGNYAGRVVVTRPPNRPVRFAVGGLTKEARPPHVRTWETEAGTGLAVELWVDESLAKFGHDHWPAAEAAIRERFPGVEIVYRD